MISKTRPERKSHSQPQTGAQQAACDPQCEIGCLELEQEHRVLNSTPPLLTLTASDEEVVLHIRGFAVLRAVYEAEGYYDEAADGDPEEQDLYRVEVLDAASAGQAAEALEGEPVGRLAALGLTDPRLRRLFPAARWAPDADALDQVKRYLLVLGHALREEGGRAARQRLLAASAAWPPEVIADAYPLLPAQWRAADSE